jgi:uncharacterized protein
MQMTGEQRIAASRARVWEALNDPEILRQSIPGCQAIEKEDDRHFRATVEVKIGPIGARFNGKVALSDMDPPNGYTITGEGQGGAVGSAKGGAKVRLSDDAGQTMLAYEVDAQVGGRLAQLGGPIIDATAKRLAGQFFTRFGEIVGGAPGPSPQALPSPSREPSAAGVAKTSPPQAGSIAWPLALVVVALAGFVVGQAQGAWVRIGFLVLVVVAVAFELGRRSASRRQGQGGES